MRTRSITRYLEELKKKSEIERISSPTYDVNIDFDEASLAWKANKKSAGCGCYKYICMHRNKVGKKCSKTPIPGCDFCCKHNSQNI
jgi:hypothetical protein